MTCSHALVLREFAPRPAGVAWRPEGEPAPPTCLLCGTVVGRGPVLHRLQEGIRARHRLPSSPWQARQVAWWDGEPLPADELAGDLA